MENSIRARKKPVEIEMIQWTGANEAAIRRFIQKDNDIHFNGNMLQVWNKPSTCWVDVPVWSWVAKGIKGELYPIEDNIKHMTFEDVLEPTITEPNSPIVDERNSIEPGD